MLAIKQATKLGYIPLIEGGSQTSVIQVQKQEEEEFNIMGWFARHYAPKVRYVLLAEKVLIQQS